MVKVTSGTMAQKAILTAGVASVVVLGAYYGAGLRTQKEWSNEKRKHAETTTDEQIAVLEIQKKHLLKQKRAWEQKLDAFYSRVKERDSKKDVK